MNALLLFGTFLFLLALSLPVSVSMGLAVMVTILVFQEVPMVFLVQGFIDAVSPFPILAIPLYIFAGMIMANGGIAKDIVRFAKLFIGGTRGGLLNVAILACAIFAAISGSSTATTVAIGSLLMKELTEAGYSRAYSSAVVAAGGTLGPVIPPSICFLVFGSMTGVSVVSLFIAGAVPGLLMAAALILTNYIICIRSGIREEGNRGSIKELVQAVWKAKWALMAPLLILGGIYGGIFTPTEAGGIAAAYGIFVGMAVYKEIDLPKLRETFVKAMLLSAAILSIVGVSGAFGRIITIEQIPQTIAAMLMAVASSKWSILLLINIILLIAGCLIEGTAIVLILTPILFPIARSIGIDPIHFGVILCINLSIGAITPPLGVCLFASSAVGGEPIQRIVKAIVPLLIALLLVLALVTYIPQISLWLPQLMAK